MFVAHSLGGLVVQDAICTSRGHAEKYLRQISSCTKGILFLGTPTYGADAASWVKLGTKLVGVLRSANSDIVAVLKPGSEMLASVQDFTIC